MRKHDKFNYNYGWRTAPEQWSFYHNGKLIELDCNIRNNLACLCISGKVTEAENELKRIIRKQQHNYKQSCCIGFYEVNSSSFYYTQQLIADRNNLSDMLRIYKEWKHYIIERNCKLKTLTETTGTITPYGCSKTEEVDLSIEINLSKPIILKVRY